MEGSRFAAIIVLCVGGYAVGSHLIHEKQRTTEFNQFLTKNYPKLHTEKEKVDEEMRMLLNNKKNLENTLGKLREEEPKQIIQEKIAKIESKIKDLEELLKRINKEVEKGIAYQAIHKTGLDTLQKTALDTLEKECSTTLQKTKEINKILESEYQIEAPVAKTITQPITQPIPQVKEEPVVKAIPIATANVPQRVPRLEFPYSTQNLPKPRRELVSVEDAVNEPNMTNRLLSGNFLIVDMEGPVFLLKENQRKDRFSAL
jgi:hypothetical protein